MDKEKKYDRQLRLWAAGGQSSLENSHICLINASTVGCEALKNLVLPGCGQFTIIDNHSVTDSDLSSNFFLEQSDIGKSRGDISCKNLNELNSDVKGHFISGSLPTILNKDSSIWDQFTVVISNNVYGDDFEKLSDVLWSKNIPLLSVSVVGFYGYLRLISPETTVVETHPESLTDLRIDSPWPELKEYVDSIDIDALDETDHAHIPYIIILIKSLDLWTKEKGNPPKTYQEKKEFKSLIGSFRRGIETNFDEAVAFSWRASQKTNITEPINEILSDPKSLNVNLSTPLFWIYVKALRNYLKTDESGGLLPLSGVLPDMASNTKNYVSIQIIYRNKAKADRAIFAREVKRILTQIGRTQDEATEQSIDIFCKNARFLYVQRGSKHKLNDSLIKSIGNDDQSLNIYLAFLAYQQFVSNTKKVPQFEDEESLLKTLTNIIHKFGIDSPPFGEELRKTFKEMSSAEGCETHNTASFMGGICSQEALKLVTGQYRPLDNTMVFDGINSTTGRWKI